MKTIPKDCQRYSKKQLCKRILLFILLLLLCLSSILYLEGRATPGKRVPFRIVCHVVLLFLPFLITGFPWKCFDYTFTGKILRKKLKITVESENPFTRSTKLYYKHHIYLYIQKPNGKVIRRKTSTSKDTEEEYLSAFPDGAEVFHLKGSHFVICIPDEKSKQIQCAICGYYNETDEKTCRRCKHTLIK